MRVNKKPKVSIILTSFNHAKYLNDAIDSAINQSFNEFELIIWDDASSDNSWEIIESYQDPRIKIYRNDFQKGGVYGINKAISEIVQGEYIAIHHSDDVWEPEKLAKQVDFLDRHSDYGAVFTNASIIDENGEVLLNKNHHYYSIFDQHNRSRHDWLRHFILNGNALCHPSVLIRKKCYQDCGLYLKGLVQLADYDMWIRLALRYEIHVLQDKLIRFRVRDNAANSSADRLDTRVRSLYETTLILNNYLLINDYQDVTKIFPEAAKYLINDQKNAQYSLAMAILELQTNPVIVKFALDVLFRLMNSVELGINDSVLIHDFVSYVTKFDPMQVATFDYFIKSISEREDQIASLSKIVSERDSQISYIASELSELSRIISEVSVWGTELQATLVERDEQVRELSRNARELSVLGRMVTECDGQISYIASELSELSRMVSEVSVWGTELQAKLAERDEQVSELTRNARELSDWGTGLQAKLAERDEQVSELTRNARELSEWGTGLQAKLAERDNQVVVLTEEIVKLDDRAVALGAELNAEREKVFAIHNSTSWVITEPLRKLKRLTTRRNSITY